MIAAFFENRTVSMVHRPTPVPGPGEALVRPLLAGICSTDVALFKGYYGFRGIPGHEFVGRAVSCPDQPEWEGLRVVAGINSGCGACLSCRADGARHCPDRKVLGIRDWDGAFAEYLTVPAANLHAVDDAVPDAAAVFAEPLAAALRIARQVPIGERDRMLVLGDGKLGLLIALALREHCPGLILAGRHAKKLKIAADQGVRTGHVRRSEGPADLEKRLGRFDTVIEATGQPDGVNFATALVRPEGTIVLKTTSHRLSEVNLSGIVVDEIRIIGSRCGDMADALDFLKNRRMRTGPLIEAVYPFQDFEAAFRHARRPGAGKILILFDLSAGI